jgi:hypothetical protein
MVGFWTRMDSRVAGQLPGYHKVSIKSFDYLAAAAEWEFTFDESGRRMTARGIAFRAAGNRGYAILWATRESDWDNSLPDYQSLLDSFKPAR